jgi:hypothetical protein
MQAALESRIDGSVNFYHDLIKVIGVLLRLCTPADYPITRKSASIRSICVICVQFLVEIGAAI